MYVSKKAVRRTLTVGAVVVGAIAYMTRVDPDRKEIGLLWKRKLEKVEDIDQFLREKEKAYKLMCEKFPNGA
ncbi:hypothetical protein V7S43_015386 [Phytophthora oleae]|uniref:Uncharacterized protein n=1 Tax=Phytophthora oleae TaxID=2107226 RepID=A0ABD3EZN0_9STRA